MNPQLAEAIADGCNVAGVAIQEAIDPAQDFRFGPGIAKLAEPRGVFIRPGHHRHLSLIRYNPIVDNSFQCRFSLIVDRLHEPCAHASIAAASLQ
jgi:hypothetical protein